MASTTRTPTRSTARAFRRAGRWRGEAQAGGGSDASPKGAGDARADRAGVAPDGGVTWLVVRGARQNNLKNVTVEFPLGRFVCVTGVSGSGKSSLVNDVLHAGLMRELHAAGAPVGEHDGIEIAEAPGLAPSAARSASAAHRLSSNVAGAVDKVIAIDQTPIGRTPRSNPATYVKLFDEIRDLFTRLPDAKLRGYKAGRFSFNVSSGKGGGRCEACEGNGSHRIEMDFLADVWVTCPVCEGRRFTRETLQVRFGAGGHGGALSAGGVDEGARQTEKTGRSPARLDRGSSPPVPHGYSIADVLEMDVQQALRVFENQPGIRRMLQCLHDVGLDYIKLGQPSPTLSGGEAQRIKLARELVKRPTGRTVYILDEPTTGLHFEDIRKLLEVLHGFVDAGNTVIVIEHNLDVIKTADWLIDLGPEGGDAGGRVVVAGTPEEVAACEASHTGRALREVLRQNSEVDSQKSLRQGRRAPTAAASQSVQRTSDLVPPNPDVISVRGARQHNLKDLTVAFPRNRMTVCTGVSGSGKTSFAIDTVFTEGYRRYVESLSAYARQFLGQMQMPKVEHVEGLSPAICIEQKAAARSPRSTVGTITEVYDYMRVLWARLGTQYCPTCNVPIGSQTVDEIVDRVMALPPGTPIILLAPLRLGDGETYAGLFQRLKRSGYTRVRVDGTVLPTAEATTLDARRRHRVEVVVDRTIVKANRGRVAESVEHALSLGNGVMVLVVEPLDLADEAALRPAPQAEETGRRPPPAASREIVFSQKRVCLKCHAGFEELSPHHFSFNAPLGWCETCEGLGIQRGAPAAEIIVRPARSILDGALAGWRSIDRRSPMGRMLAAVCERIGVRGGRGVAPVDVPLAEWTAEQRNALLFGLPGDAWIESHGVWGPGGHAESGGDGARVGGDAGGGVQAAGPRGRAMQGRFQWRGLFPTLDAAMRHSWSLRYRLHAVVTDIACLSCCGGRLRPEARAVRLDAGVLGSPGRHSERSEESGCVDAGVVERRGQMLRIAQHDPGERPQRGPTIVDVCDLPLNAALAFFRGLRLDERQRRIAGDVVDEIVRRLQFLVDVGLEYVTLNRAGPTLSGGEAQRIRLASQIGSGLTGVLYVLDEPTIGLHPRDTRRLIDALTKLRDLGNTLLLVEHDRDVIAAADRVLDFGPRAGAAGGEVVADAAPAELRAARRPGEAPADPRPAGGCRLHASDPVEPISTMRSLTRAYLSGSTAIPIPTNRRPVPRNGVDGSQPPTAGRGDRGGHPPPADAHHWLIVRGARQHNLKDIDVSIPLGRLVCVTGVSGSGKSSLVNDILWPALARELHKANAPVGEHDGIEIADAPGLSPPRKVRLARFIDKVVNVDQSPIGATPLSNPATYTGVFDWIRELFARLPESKLRGWQANRFSFNRPGGRCEACEGQGQKRIEMHFMPDVWVACDSCGGKRYTTETLEVRYRGKNIADVLDLRVDDALRVFANVPKVRRLLQTLADVGLGYVQLGQSAPTLSGGEAQRVKLAAELGKPDTGRTLYILDEPTTGLHFDDVRKLLDVLHRLVDLGNTVLVVEHNLDVLKCADWIIDLGPEAGEQGGYVVAAGTPEEVVLSARASLATNSESGAEIRGQTLRCAQHDNQTLSLDGHSLSARGHSRCAEVHSRSADGGPLSARGQPPGRATSHTARALAPVLAAGPRAERRAYDAAEHAAREIEVERARFGDVGKGVRMPWQIDGRRWHLEHRTGRNGRPVRWERAALEYVIERVEAEGRRAPGERGRRAVKGSAAARADAAQSRFLPTNWNNQASVEVAAPGRDAWFLHALTGGEWLLELYFCVPPGTFDGPTLNRALGLKTLDEREDVPSYGDWPRVEVRPRQTGMEVVVLYVHDRAEIDTPAFRAFVRRAAAAYLRGR